MSLTTGLLKQLADVYRSTTASDGQGGQTRTFALSSTAKKCKIDQASPSEQIEAQQAGVSMTHKIYFEHDADVQRGDEVRNSGKAYRVADVVGPSRPGVYLRADSEFIQSEDG